MGTLTARILITSFCLLVASKCLGQQTLAGKITDSEDHQPIPGATIYFPDLKKGAVADPEGNYKVLQLPKGKFLAQFQFVGYATEVRLIEVSGATVYDIEMSTTATELKEIIVTGISHSSELKSNPIPIVTVNAKALTENTATNLIDNISKEAGINQITTGSAISKPVIRGLGYNRIISLYDGVKQEGQQWGDEHGIEIDEFSVDRVEIIKGAGSLMYGSDGLGGVINFLAPDPVALGTIKGQWISNYQTNNGLFANSLSNSGNIKGLYWQARLTQKNARPYSNENDGRVFNSGFKELDVNGFVGISRAWGYSQMSMSSFSQSVGLVEGERDAAGNFVYLVNNNGVEEEATATTEDLRSYTLFIPRQSINHLRMANTTNLYMGTSRLQASLSYQNNKRREYGNVLDETEKSLFFDLTTINYNLNFFLPETSDRQISFGTSGMQQENKNRGVEFLIPEYRLFDWGAFGFVKQTINTLNIAGGIRYDLRKIYGDPLLLDDEGNPSNSGAEKFKPFNADFSNVTASLGLSQKIGKVLTAKLNASRGFRAPTVAELASNGRHEGSFRYEIGNPALKAETSFQIDAGLHLESDHITTEISVFRNDIHNYIYVEKLLTAAGTDSIPDPSEPAPAYHYTQGHAVLTGGEFRVDLHPHPFDWLHFENSFSFVNAVNKSQVSDSSKYLPFTPAPRYQCELRATVAKCRNVFANLFFNVEFNHYWKQDHVFLENGTETPTPSYSLWNAGLGGDVLSARKKNLFSFYITVVNVFDRAYQNHLSRLKYAPENPQNGLPGVFNLGRNVSFKIVVPIVFRSDNSKGS